MIIESFVYILFDTDMKQVCNIIISNHFLSALQVLIIFYKSDKNLYKLFSNVQIIFNNNCRNVVFFKTFKTDTNYFVCPAR